MTPDLQRVLATYIECGWVDASLPPADAYFPIGCSAYLVLASGVMVPPLSEVQVTARCECRAFRAYKMIVAEDSGRFHLTDLKIRFQSQLAHAQQDVPLHAHVYFTRGSRAEVRPDPICWPLDICHCGDDVEVRAIIPDKEDPGVEFEIVLLGEAVF